MSEREKNIIRKHAGGIWFLGAVLTFVCVYLLMDMIAIVCGAPSGIAENVAIGISSTAATGMYVALAIWGLRNL